MASGDKFYLADKETLDEVDEKIGSTKDTGGSSTAGSVFGKINYLVSQVSSYLATIYSWVNTLMGKIGNTNDSEGTATTGTVMGKLNYLVARMESVYSWVNNIFSRVGTTTDTGGTTTAGSLMAKENAILAELNKIGNTEDSEATSVAGTVMGKLNTLFANLNVKLGDEIELVIGDTAESKSQSDPAIITGRGWICFQAPSSSTSGSSYSTGFKIDDSEWFTTNSSYIGGSIAGILLPFNKSVKLFNKASYQRYYVFFQL